MFLGLDSSTQSLSATLIDTGEGRIAGEWSVGFGEDLPRHGQPSGFIPGGEGGEVHASPLMWLDALDLLFGRMKEGGAPLGEVTALSGSGQQHGSVYLNGRFAGVLAGLSPSAPLAGQVAPALSRPTSPIWMDSSTAEECREIASFFEAAGGDAEVCRRSGSVATPRFTGPQIRRFSKIDPEGWAATESIHLVSSFMASVLAGKPAAIDPGDGAGMNLLNLAEGDWDDGLLEATAGGLREKLPPVRPADTVAGEVARYFVERHGFSPSCRVVLWSGDNPCSLVGMGAARPGKVVVSLGTSDTLFAALPEPRTDPGGFGHVFGNPAGGFMSLICFRNGSLAREAVRDEWGLGWEDFEAEALSATPAGNGGKLMLPFFEPEITPRADTGGAVYSWENRTAPECVRAVLEGQFLSMRRHSRWIGVEAEEILLTGGASRNNGIARTVSNVFQARVSRLEVTGSAALGAALRAAAACGESLPALEETFCRPVEGSAIHPDPATAETYREAEERLGEMLSAAGDLHTG